MNLHNPQELVSVILPVYNAESYIEQCLNSLSRQTYTNFEVILIDDGSTDCSGRLCDVYAASDCRFKVTHQENAGVSAARNSGLAEANGKYILFVDSDDYLSNDYIEVLVECLQSTHTKMACADYYIVKDGVESTHSSVSNKVKVMPFMDAINVLHVKKSFQGYLWNKIFIRSIIAEYQITFEKDVKIWEDMLFCLKYLTKIDTVSYIEKPVYYYVQRTGSAMSSPEVWKEYTHLIALEKMWDAIQPHDGAFKEYIRDFYSNDLVGLLGKAQFIDKDILHVTIRKLKELNGKLSFKHRIKILLFKIKLHKAAPNNTGAV